MAPGGSVVSWTSRDSEVARWPLSTLRISAVLEARGVSFSNGYMADGNAASSSAGIGGAAAGRNAAGSIAHKFRRVMDMGFLRELFLLRHRRSFGRPTLQLPDG